MKRKLFTTGGTIDKITSTPMHVPRGSRNTLASDPCSRIVITHGSNTMIEMATSLRGLAGKTIVLTGSTQPARFKTADTVSKSAWPSASSKPSHRTSR